MEIFEYIRIFECVWIFEYIRIFFLQYEYIRIGIRIEIALTNIFVFVFGPEKNICSPLIPSDSWWYLLIADDTMNVVYNSNECVGGFVENNDDCVNIF